MIYPAMRWSCPASAPRPSAPGSVPELAEPTEGTYRRGRPAVALLGDAHRGAPEPPTPGQDMSGVLEELGCSAERTAEVTSSRPMEESP